MVSAKRLEKVAIIGGIAALAYFYLQAEEAEEAQASGSCGPLYRLSEDGQMCEPKLKCREGFVLSPDATQCFDAGNPCGPGFKQLEDGTCEITDDACGDKCYKLNDAKDDCIKIPNCGTATGSELGDVFLYLGESIVAGVIYDYLGRKVMDAAERKLQREAAKKAALEASKKAANESAQKIAQAVATETAKKGQAAGERLATKIAQGQAAKNAGKLAAKNVAKNVAITAAKKLASRVAVAAARMATTASTGIGVLLMPLMILSTSLSVGLTAAGVVFRKNNPSDHQWTDLPEGLQVAVEAVPVIGDVISILSNFLAFTDNCNPGMVEQNGLCYPPPEPGFTCEAFLCYAQDYPGFEPLSQTQAHFVKRTITDTGKVPQKCRPGQEHAEGIGGFCYDIQTDKPGHNVLGTWWEHCAPGEKDDLAFCSRESWDPVPDGCWLVGADVWCNRQDHIIDCINHPATGGDCKRWGVENCFWSGAKCNAWGVENCTDLFGCCRVCTWNAAQCRSWGGNECSWNAAQCAEWNPLVGCGESVINVPYLHTTLAARYHFSSRPKESRVLTPRGNICEDNQVNIDDLCYIKDIPTGFRRVVVGTLDQMAPPDKPEWRSLQNFNSTKDVGAIIQKATYTRPPFPKIGVYAMKREVIEDPPDPPLPPLCSTLPILAATDKDYNQRLCRMEEPPAGFELSQDGLSFYKKCRDLFSFNFTNTNCEKIADDGKLETYSNVEGIQQVEYDFK
jgi:hypothetical protein